MRDLERYNRNIRNENRTSISTGKGEPKLQEGNEGDIRINSTKGGVKLYAKYKGYWHSMGLAKLLNKPKKISPIGIPTIEQDEIEIRKVVEHAQPGEAAATFESDIRVLGLKVNEIIESIQ